MLFPAIYEIGMAFAFSNDVSQIITARKEMLLQLKWRWRAFGEKIGKAVCGIF
jgi:hypothetical protein